MNPERLVKIANVKSVKPGRGLVCVIDQDEVALFYIDGKYYAVSNICPHQLSPLIAEGDVRGLTVECPMHGWTFDLSTGKAVQGEGATAKGGGRLEVYPVHVQGEDIYIELPEEDDKPAWWDY